MLTDLSALIPELLLAICLAGSWIAGRVRGGDTMAVRVLWIIVAAMAVLAIWLFNRSPVTRPGFDGMILDDPLARYGKVLCLGLAALVLAMGRDLMQRRDMMRLEFPLLVGLMVLGLMIMLSATDLVVLFIGGEIAGLSGYVLTAFRRRSPKSNEAGLKALLLGAVFTVIALNGMALIYSASGSTAYTRLGAADLVWEMRIGTVLLLAGLCFRLGAAPFHFGLADVQQGAPAPVSALLICLPTVVITIVLARLLNGALGFASDIWQPVLAIMAALSMLAGSFAMLRQTHIKRFLTYAAVLNAGYILAGLATTSGTGLSAALLQATVFAVIATGLYAFVFNMEKDGQPYFEIDALRGYVATSSRRAFALVLLLVGLAGLPPLVNIFARFFALQAAYDAGFTALAVVGVLVMPVAAYSCLRLVWLIFDTEQGAELDGKHTRIASSVMIVSAGVMFIGTFSLFGLDDATLEVMASLAQ